MNERVKKFRRITHLAATVAVVLFVSYMFYISMGRSNQGHIEKIHFEESSHYQDGGKNTMTFDGHLKSNIIAKEQIFFQVHHQQVTIRVNGRTIYEYGEKQIPKQMKSIGNEWLSFRTFGIKASDRIEFTIQNVYGEATEDDYNSFFNHLYVGDRSSLLHLKLQGKRLQLFIATLIFTFGVIMLVVAVTLQLLRADVPKGYIACGMLMISGGLCTTIDYEYATLLFPNALMVNIVDAVTEIFIVEFLLYYLRSYVTTARMRRIVSFFIYAWTGLYIFLFFGQGTGLLDIEEFTIVYLPIIIFMVSLSLFIFVEEYRIHSDERMRSFAWSGLLLGLFTFVEIVHYFITKQFWIVVFQFGLLIFTIVQFKTMVFYTKKARENARKEAKRKDELRQQLMVKKIELLKPEFFYRTLLAIRDLDLEKKEQVKDALDSFTKYLNYDMEILKTDELVPFRKEVEHIRNYVLLEQLQTKQRWHIEEQFETMDFTIAPFVLLPLVENAIQYAIPVQADATLTLTTKVRGDYIEVVVKDCGRGFDVNELMKDENSGLHQVENRIETMLNGKVRVISKIGTGTEVVVFIPKEEKS